VLSTRRTLLSLTIILLASHEAFSCSCADPSVREKFRAADLVFLGRVVEVKRAPDNAGEIFDHVTFDVEKRWKGPRGPRLTLAWGFDNPGMCNDLPLTPGERYLIYSSRETIDYRGRRRSELTIRPDCGPHYLAQHREAEIRKLDRLWFRISARLYPFPKP
jgi:hypothetical protein